MKGIFYGDSLIATPFQGKGVGRRAIGLLVEYLKTRPGATELGVSCSQGEGNTEGFYLKLDFKHNGKMHGSEIGRSLQFEN